MSKFDPLTFLDVAKELVNGANQSHWRTSMGRAYYAAFGFIKLKIPAASSLTGKNTHERIIFYLQNSSNPQERKIGKDLETLFEQRVHADYDYNKVVTQFFTKLPIELAERIILELGKIGVK